jgi:DNA-binding MarR family transcriptional regulator
VLSLRPDQLAEKHDPSDLLAALRSRRVELTDTQREAVDYALAHWATEALARPGDSESVVMLDSLCALAARRAGTGGDRHIARWQAWRTLLENKRLAIAGRASGRASRLLQFQPILDALAGGQVKKQVQLAEDLGLTPARISQLLAVMEEAGAVLRRRVGRDVEVSLPASAPAITPAPTRANTTSAAPRATEQPSRFGGVFIQHREAA